MADYGKTATEYKPAAGIYTGLIGKIAEEVIRGEMVKGHFDSLIKGTFTSGKDLEVALLKRATGAAYNRTTPPKPGAPEVSVLYHTQDTARTYGVLIDDNEIQEGTISAENANKYAAEVVQTLYNGAEDETNDYIVSILKDANAAANQIVEAAYKYNDYKTERGCKELLQAINTNAAYIRKGERSVNPQGNKVMAASVGVLIPERILQGLNVWARMGAYNAQYSAIDADYIFTYTPDEGDEGDIFVFDTDYMQIWKKRPDSYKEHPIAGCDNVEAFLHRYMLYAGCPLFSCVKIKPDPAPQDYTQNTVKAVMYANNGNGVAPVLGSMRMSGATEGVALLADDGTEGGLMGVLATSTQNTYNEAAGIREKFEQVSNANGIEKVYTASRG